ncbi:MAG: hypothetical protein SNG35_04590 [Rikenellaceae bacterium]
MDKLTKLDKACLANMAMMIDVIESTIDKLDLLLAPYQDEFVKLLKDSNYEVNATKRVYTCTWGGVGLVFKISASKKYRRKLNTVEIEFGYTCDKSQNVICFQEMNNFNDEIHANIPSSFNKGRGNEDGGLYVEFSIDDTLSEGKIRECADCFIEYILNPIMV